MEELITQTINQNPSIGGSATESAKEAPVVAVEKSQNQGDGRLFAGRQGFRRGGRGGGGGGMRGRRSSRPLEKPEYDQKTLDIARVARVTKGGKRFTFRSTVVIGNGKGRVGVGIGKGKDVAQSIQKAFNQAKKNLMDVVIVNGTIPYQVEAKYSSAVVVIKPSRGGIKAGGPVRVVAQLAGITALTGKLIERTNNKINIAMATIEALKKLRVKDKRPSAKSTEALNSKP